MGSATFKGSAHPYEGKELPASKPIEALMSEGRLVYPLSQHIGAPAKPLVKKGDQVLAGQIIGKACGLMSANVIYSMSGAMRAVEPRWVVSGSMAESIVVENDGGYKTVGGTGVNGNPSGLSKQEIRDITKEAGIVGPGGTGFPIHIKLIPKEDDKIEYVIINGTECELYLASDYRLMLEQPEKIIGGLNIILDLLDKVQGVIGIEGSKPEAITRMTELAKNEPRIKVAPLKTKYPQGGGQTLIRAVTGRKINSTMPPADMGCIVDSADTVSAIYMVICYRTLPLRRIFIVTGGAAANPGDSEMRIGICQQKLTDATGGFKTEPEKIMSNDPMVGQTLFDLNIPATKTSPALTCMTKDEVVAQGPTACICYGRYAEVCPGCIVPQKLMRPVLDGDLEIFEKLHGMERCGCDYCAFICPARKQLTQAFKGAKLAVRIAKRKAWESEE